MQSVGIKTALRGNHGMTHSAYVVDPDGHGIEVLYDLPKDVWEGDVDAALSYFEPLPPEGPESLRDSTDYVRFGAPT
jgi:catechol 2,3-dioxygenase